MPSTDFQKLYDALEEAVVSGHSEWGKALPPSDRKKFFRMMNDLREVHVKVEWFRDKFQPKDPP